MRADKTRDPHGIKWELLGAIAEYCSCRAWRGSEGYVFCGLKSDADYATWLLDHLTTFVQGELANYLIGCLAPKGERRRLIRSYVLGTTCSIANLLDAPKPIPTSSNSRDLIVIRTEAIADKMKKLGIKVRTVHTRRRYVDPDAYDAGIKAGKRANIGRPVAEGATMNRLSGAHVRT